MEEAPSPAPALWDWDYLYRCFAHHRVCISFGLWICACCCWIAAHALLLYLMCAKRFRQAQSALCAACCLLTSLCDAVGAILARQLTIQVFTGAYLAAIDLMNFVFILIPLCGSKFKSNLGHSSQERKSRQQLRATVFALTLPLSLGPCWALWAAIPKASGLVHGPQRRLLGSLLQNLDWVPLTTLPHCKSLGATAAISRYMELIIEPVRQTGCSATRLPGDGQMCLEAASLQEPPSYPPIQVIRARVSSSSSSEGSSINSDLEWAPEDTSLEGNKDNVEMLRPQMHGCSRRPFDLTSDEGHFLEPPQQLRAQSQVSGTEQASTGSNTHGRHLSFAEAAR